MEWCISSCGKYRIESLTPKTFPGAMEVLRKAFVYDEYINIATEVNKHPQAIGEFLMYAASVALDGVTVVAVEIDTGQVASVCFNKIDVLNDKDKLLDVSEIHPSTQGLLEFKATLGRKIDVADIYKADCSFELLFLATLEQHRHKNLGYFCCKASVDVARKLQEGPVSPIKVEDLGPQFSILESKSMTKCVPKVCKIVGSCVPTQKIAKKLNFNLHLRVSFEEFSFDGKSYVERNGFDPYCEVYALQI